MNTPSRYIRVVFGSLALALSLHCAAGCAPGDDAGACADGPCASGGATSASSSGATGNGTPKPGPGPASTAPPELVGIWTAGRGGTTVAYDDITGTSASNASGLAFQFAADGTFAKAYRDSTGGGGCATVVVATESGSVVYGAGHLQLQSTHGVVQTFSSCSPSVVAKQEMPASDLDRAGYTFAFDGGDLVLTRDDGASARFRRSPLREVARGARSRRHGVHVLPPAAGSAGGVASAGVEKSKRSSSAEALASRAVIAGRP